MSSGKETRIAPKFPLTHERFRRSASWAGTALPSRPRGSTGHFNNPLLEGELVYSHAVERILNISIVSFILNMVYTLPIPEILWIIGSGQWRA